VGEAGQQTTPHPADYRTSGDGVGFPTGPDWKIDGYEANRILIYLRALGYHTVPVSEDNPDGFAPGAE